MCRLLTSSPRGRSRLVAVLTLAALVGGCPARSDLPDRRADRQTLSLLLLADGRTMQAADGPIGRLGTGHESAEVAARLEGDLADSARRVLKRARAAPVRTARGRQVKKQVVAALEERVRVLGLYLGAARSGRPEKLLEAIRSARALEEDLLALEGRVDELAP